MSRLIEESSITNRLQKERKTFGVLGVDIVNWITGYVKECPTIHAIPLEKVKAAREEISDYNIKEHYFGSDSFLIGIANGMDKAVEILDKLIAESEVAE